MDKALCWISFDFDLTVTTVHTWKALKLTKVTDANITAAGSGIILLSHPILLAKLIKFICEQDMLFCFTTMQHRQIVEAGLKAHPMVASVMSRYGGTHFFIVDRTQVHHHGNKKSQALKTCLQVTDKFSGMHFDDDAREASDFAALGMGFQHMTEGTGFAATMNSSLSQAIAKIPQMGFSNLGSATALPESIYANAANTEIPNGHDFRFRAKRSAEHPIAGFISKAMQVIMTS